jgi:anti-sigma-K factor RskA
MRDHIWIEEQLAASALSGLEPAEADELERAMADHSPRCVECRRLQEEYDEVEGRLAFALTPAQVPEGMEDRIIGQGRVGAPADGRWLRRVAATAAAAVLLVAGGTGGYLLARRPVPDLRAAASYLSEPGTTITPLVGSGQGSLALAYRPGRDVAYLIGSGLKRPPEGKIYELWLRRSGVLQPAALFSPDGEVLVVPVPSDPSTASEVAVTLEQSQGVIAPTSMPIFRAAVGA